MKKKVLIVTHSGDNECIQMVQEALSAEGAISYRLDTDRFPTETQLAIFESNQGSRFLFQTDDGEVDLNELDACWYRRFYVGGKLPKEMDKKFRNPSLHESRTMMTGFLESLDMFILDPYHRIRFAANKQVQLRIARDVGLVIPRTLMTNHPQKVREFFKTCRNGMITKMLSSFAVMEDGVEQVVFTNKIEAADLENMEGLEFCPMTFQENVPKKVELRITVIGGRVFSAAVDSQSTGDSDHDWRKDGLGLVDKWVDHQLPQKVEKQILALMDRLGLNYGAIDVIVTPDDRYVFLEINPGGEFFWLQSYSPNYPLAAAFASVLLGKEFRR